MRDGNVALVKPARPGGWVVGVGGERASLGAWQRAWGGRPCPGAGVGAPAASWKRRQKAGRGGVSGCGRAGAHPGQQLLGLLAVGGVVGVQVVPGGQGPSRGPLSAQVGAHVRAAGRGVPGGGWVHCASRGMQGAPAPPRAQGHPAGGPGGGGGHSRLLGAVGGVLREVGGHVCGGEAGKGVGDVQIAEARCGAAPRAPGGARPAQASPMAPTTQRTRSRGPAAPGGTERIPEPLLLTGTPREAPAAPAGRRKRLPDPHRPHWPGRCWPRATPAPHRQPGPAQKRPPASEAAQGGLRLRPGVSGSADRGPGGAGTRGAPDRLCLTLGSTAAPRAASSS
jgi:hypothetical protein